MPRAFVTCSFIKRLRRCHVKSLRFPEAFRRKSYSLTDQIRRASRSIGAQIAEAWAKRRYERHFVSKLTDADAEQMETQHWIDEAVACRYLDPKQAEQLKEELMQIGRMLSSMIEKARLFCGQSSHIIRDKTAEYMVDTDD
jgi:four helix bundle protein